MESFEVFFFNSSHRRTSTPVVEVLNSSFGLAGAGEIIIDSEGITLRGQIHRPFWFPKRCEISFDAAQAVNLQRHEDTLRFDILPGGKIAKAGYVIMQTDDEATAIQLAQLLPTTQTQEFVKQQQETSDFAKLLSEAPSKAIATPALVTINVLIFLAMAASGAGSHAPQGQTLIPWGSNFGPLTSDGQWWRLFTSMFLHFGIIHLAVNMYALYVGGLLVEQLYGGIHFLFLYLIAGLSGSIASLLWQPMVNSAGASGAIFGIYGGLLAFLLNRGNLIPTGFRRRLCISTGTFVMYSLSNGFTHAGIDNAAHFGGLCSGLAIGFAFTARPLDATIRSKLGTRRLLLGLVAAALILPLLALNIKNTGETFRNEQQFRADLAWASEQMTALDEQSKRLGRMLDSGVLTPEQVAQRIDQEMLPTWQTVYDRLARSKLDQLSELGKIQSLVQEDIVNRQDNYHLFAVGLREGDEGKLRQATKQILEHMRLLQEKTSQLKQLKKK